MQNFIKLLFTCLLSTLILSGCTSHSPTHKAPLAEKKKNIKIVKSTKVVTKTRVVTNQKQVKDKKQSMVGSDRDEHGCISSAGYTWSKIQSKCVRPWEEKSQTKQKSAKK